MPLPSVDWEKGSVGWVMDRAGENCGVLRPSVDWENGSVGWVMERGGGNCGGPRGVTELVVLRVSLSGYCWKEDCEGWVMDRGG